MVSAYFVADTIFTLTDVSTQCGIARTLTGLLVEGNYDLDAIHASAGRITHRFRLSITVPRTFPLEPPAVFELDGAIPRTPDYHVNGGDGSLCLGSPLALMAALQSSADLADFLSACLRPFLYAVAVKLVQGGDFVFGELLHGSAGVVQDLAARLAIPESAVMYALSLLGMRKRVANKCQCPCGSGRRLGTCPTNIAVRSVRTLASRSWFKAQRHALSIAPARVRK